MTKLGFFRVLVATESKHWISRATASFHRHSNTIGENYCLDWNACSVLFSWMKDGLCETGGKRGLGLPDSPVGVKFKWGRKRWKEICLCFMNNKLTHWFKQ